MFSFAILAAILKWVLTWMCFEFNLTIQNQRQFIWLFRRTVCIETYALLANRQFSPTNCYNVRHRALLFSSSQPTEPVIPKESKGSDEKDKSPKKRNADSDEEVSSDSPKDDPSPSSSKKQRKVGSTSPEDDDTNDKSIHISYIQGISLRQTTHYIVTFVIRILGLQ